MKIILRTIVLSLLAAVFTPFLAQAQSGDITSGFLWVGYEGAFVNQLKNIGVKTELVHYKRTGSPDGFLTTAGTVNLATGQGEVQTAGRISYKQGSMLLETAMLELDTTGKDAVVTALVLVNHVVVGRQVVFRIVSNFPYRFDSSDGTIDTGAFHYRMDPVFWAELCNFFQITLNPGPTSGELRLVAHVTASDPNPTVVSAY